MLSAIFLTLATAGQCSSGVCGLPTVSYSQPTILASTIVSSKIVPTPIVVKERVPSLTDTLLTTIPATIPATTSFVRTISNPVVVHEYPQASTVFTVPSGPYFETAWEVDPYVTQSWNGSRAFGCLNTGRTEIRRWRTLRRNPFSRQ